LEAVSLIEIRYPSKSFRWSKYVKQQFHVVTEKGAGEGAVVEKMFADSSNFMDKQKNHAKMPKEISLTRITPHVRRAAKEARYPKKCWGQWKHHKLVQRDPLQFSQCFDTFSYKYYFNHSMN
jgi:hypothetical protein